ncbi:PTS transporter subunit EIIC [Nocardioides ganghwensis]|jgi:PTS system N-acetylglucosamine-specific IIC component|uniref:PTS N-acetylglucosamine transporter subunit IIBC n=1 Tax=Nocardioides ganghwensis TaxID=252230 RepID=A0A4Q2S9F0_9ACTN|nr:PTS transporter subunit EIIC [Nocardioides ganghwensis]MBD3944274.1 PTS transporter subunit EIIC [Nocardioides ganghwensis]RYC00045.1 PTS N-acetylglucosamine transporter subunit IIBC [Nocardioides ganghwensis]
MTTQDAAAGGTTTDKRRLNLAPVQKFGRSLMLPIAALPVAALLLRLGQPDLLGADGLGWDDVAAVIGAAGNALFANLPLLFAVGIAIGMARKSDGSTALAAVVGYLVFQGVGDAMSPVILGAPEGDAEQELINYGVLGGIVTGLVSAWLWQRYHRISLPPYLAFFGGRRFVPIITAFAMLVISVLMSFVYPAFDAGITGLGEWVTDNAILGGFVYGTLNRLLIPLGLHHILNNPPWFIFGEYTAADGQVYHGDIGRFLAGDPTAGAFMTGFFPIMMFALPAAALAIWHEARPENKKLVGGIMLSAALTAFLTGVTEPLEFAFMFVAFPLYVIHALLTGSSMALTNALGIKDGFGFSAGLFDYVLNFNIATKPLLIIPIGLAYAAVYYFLFRFVIRKWNLRTPGREDDTDTADGGSLLEQDNKA